MVVWGMNFKPAPTTMWLSDYDRFIIRTAYPKGFSAEDTYNIVGHGFEGESLYRTEFFDTFEEAVAWCEERAKR